MSTSASPVPILGLGVYQMPSSAETEEAILQALKLGYRHIDTAQYYANEADVGNAIRRSGIPREEIFVTSKMFTVGKGPTGISAKDHAIACVDDTLAKSGLGYIDLYLLHSPHEKDIRLDRWKGLEECVAQKKLRYIGVSNYGVHHLKELLANCKIKPVCNQIEANPFCQRNEIREFCQENGIALVAYSPLAKGQKLDDPTLKKIASKHSGMSTAQVMLRWCLQMGMIIIPKSVNPERMKENMEVIKPAYALTDDDMKELSKLDEDLITGWNPTTLP